MSRQPSKILAIFFAACFLAFQFHAISETQLAQNAKQILHIEELSTRATDKGIETTFVDAQSLQAEHAYEAQQKSKHNQQRLAVKLIQRQVDHEFRPFMRECLASICRDHQDRAITTINYLHKRELSFEFRPIFVTNTLQVHSDESDCLASLS